MACIYFNCCCVYKFCCAPSITKAIRIFINQNSLHMTSWSYQFEICHYLQKNVWNGVFIVTFVKAERRRHDLIASHTLCLKKMLKSKIHYLMFLIGWYWLRMSLRLSLQKKRDLILHLVCKILVLGELLHLSPSRKLGKCRNTLCILVGMLSWNVLFLKAGEVIMFQRIRDTSMCCQTTKYYSSTCLS